MHLMINTVATTIPAAISHFIAPCPVPHPVTYKIYRLESVNRCLNTLFIKYVRDSLILYHLRYTVCPIGSITFSIIQYCGIF